MLLVAVLRSVRVNNTLTSPRVVFPNSELCIQVVFRTDNNRYSDQLSASVVDVFQNQHALDVFHTKQVGRHLFKSSIYLIQNLFTVKRRYFGQKYDMFLVDFNC